MNDIFVNSNDIEQVSKQLSLITQYIKHIFSKIKDCKTIEEAATYFSLLDRMQSVLAELVYKHEIGIPERL